MKDEEWRTWPADAPELWPRPSSLSAESPRPVITRTSQTLSTLIDEATFHNHVAGKRTPALSLLTTCGSIITGGEEVGLRGALWETYKQPTLRRRRTPDILGPYLCALETWAVLTSGDQQFVVML
ncbi:hypothetical protein SKAU_G00306280 [Synaphobranchus kaupii]|uniref:Uncharacterized protein n=1 Tax=Synaphobranchus kaupii TaxID=118154 RepID=A0A9Q1IIQ1_SYNKA|nr:hypothetical protein SKAU_G00306280 [Synaphobranchus kaupii]